MVAVRKRRCSTDEKRGAAQPPPSGVACKKARVFFSGAQKAVLREAYTHDPYPNQARIDWLAAQLGVQQKALVNWFHNHRMRAKQQQHGDGGGGGGGSRTDVDSLSNHSDSQSSESAEGARGGATPLPPPPTADHVMSQWLFPQFEPIALHRGAGEGGDGEAATDLSMKVKVERGVTPDGATAGRLGAVKTEPEEVAEGVMEDGLRTGAAAAADRPAINRRKSAKPQRAFDGARLDRLADANGDAAEEGGTGDGGGGGEGGGEVLARLGENTDRRGGFIEKIQAGIAAADMDWDEVDRKENIDKLQRHLQQACDDWEF